METRIAKIISAVLHPLLIPTYSYIILLSLKTYFAMIIPFEARWKIVLLVFIITFMLPAIFTYLLYWRGVIKSLHMETREERTFPYLITAIFFYLAYYMLNKLQIAPVFSYFMIGATFLLIITLVINLFWKISSHMVAMGAVMGAVTGISLLLVINLKLLIMIIILVSGLVAYSRLKLNAHFPAQVYAGFVLGAVVMAGLAIIL